MKKNGGTIRNWQVHTLSMSQEIIDKTYPGENLKPMLFTGTVKKDVLGRWEKDHYMRSSLIVSIDREKGVIETRNTIYKVVDEGGDSVSQSMSGLLDKNKDAKNDDIGDNVMNLFF